MQFAPIPDDMWDELQPSLPTSRRQVVMPPNNDLDSGILPVDAIIEQSTWGTVYRLRATLDPGDLSKLLEGADIWLAVFTPQLMPVSIGIGLFEDGGPIEKKA